MSDEYNLKTAGFFTEEDLLDFKASEEEKGNTVRLIYITPKQLTHLIISTGLKPRLKTTGKKLVDFWNTPDTIDGVNAVHGVEIRLES